MVRYEANIDGELVEGEPFTDFDELSVLENIFSDLNWVFELLRRGRGGYYLFNITFPDNQSVKMHLYLKIVTFGGREKRPFEKRVQFAAGLDRNGFEQSKNETDSEFCLILGLYKRSETSDTLICAWDIHDWGNNAGHAFNCFVNVKKIAEAFKEGYSQHITSKGQIACCFRPDYFCYYLDHKKALHRKLEAHGAILFEDQEEVDQASGKVPAYYDLFQLIIDIMRDNGGKVSVDVMETEAANKLNLSYDIRNQIHNSKEGFRTELGYQLAWARTYLKRAGLLYTLNRANWAFTEAGWNTDIVRKEDILTYAPEKEIGDDVESNSRDYLILEADGGVEIEAKEEGETSKIVSPFDPGLVDIRTRTMTLDLILKRLRNEEINMATGFQRKANLWDIEKQSRLIESILVKFPLPVFYFDGSDDDNWLVVDGLQRLSSLDNYVNEQLFGLQGLEFLTQFEGLKFNQLPGYLKRRIEEFEITAYVIAAGTPKVLKYNVFKRINTGGLILTSQEIRNALNQGEPAKFVKELAGLRSFKLATNYSISEDRMLDQEFVVRFLAFHLLNIENDYDSDLDAFLNKAMERLYDKEIDYQKIKRTFDRSMQAAFNLFRDDAFRKRYDKDDRRKPINKALFDSWSVNLAKLSESEIAVLIDKKEELKDRFILLLNTDSYFNKAITSATGDKSRVKKRFNEIENLITSLLVG